MKGTFESIDQYDDAQTPADRAICVRLRGEIDAALPRAESKIWHGSPVWFVEGNPIVGYHKLKSCVRLLFWSGQSFDEEDLAPEGSFKAAEIRYMSVDEIKVTALRRWLSKAKRIQWDYANLVKRKGKLLRRE